LKYRLIHLDCLRGLAALLVVLEHLRAFLFVPYSKIKCSGILLKLFYFITCLGHQAVIVFFVLSGFLVGGSVLNSFQKGTWTWSGYLIRRMSRLWVVLIPALILTFLWDHAGILINTSGYNGGYLDLYHSGPGQTHPADLSFKSFIGNLFFLQTVVVPVFGTNGPLWSLANEFWYYLIFPVGLALFTTKTQSNRVLYLAVMLFLFFLLPTSIILLGFAWGLGVISYLMAHSQIFCEWAKKNLYLGLSLLFVTIILVLSRVGKLGNLFDYILAVSIMLLIPSLAVRTVKPGPYSKISIAASEVSYTLYLVHCPPLFFLFFTKFGGRQYLPSVYSLGLFLFLIIAVLIYSAAIWWFFERNTEKVRQTIERIQPFNP